MANDFTAYAPPNGLHVDHLTIRLGVSGGSYNTYFEFDILDADDNSVKRRQGDLISHLTPAQITGLKTLLDALLVKAQATV